MVSGFTAFRAQRKLPHRVRVLYTARASVRVLNLSALRNFMSMKMITVAQIGVGYWGPNLLRNLSANPRCEVKVVVELSESRRKFVKDLYPNVKVSSEIASIVEDPAIDAVVISTPVRTHFDLALKCIAAGKSILVEKPMATSAAEVDQIREMAESKNVTAMVGHTFLFNNSVHYIKKMIDNHELGDIRYVYSQRLNLGRIRNDVDALWNFAPHDVSIIQYWLDNPRPESITRSGMAYVQSGINDVEFLNIVYPNKIIANIHVSWLDPHKTRKMTIVGSKKMVVYDDVSDHKVTVFDKGIDPTAKLGHRMDFDNPSALQFNHRSGEIFVPHIPQVEPLAQEIDHFIDCILGIEDCIADASHAQKVVSILESAKKVVS